MSETDFEKAWLSEFSSCLRTIGGDATIWEHILQQPVKVELLESVLKGDDVCKVAIHLPARRP